MPPLVYQFAGGAYVLPATALLAVIIVSGAFVRTRWITILRLVLGVLAVATIIVSAPAMPWWFDGLWATSVLAWTCTKRAEKRSLISWSAVPPAVALLCTVAGGLMELGYEQSSPLPPGHVSTLCVIGDSVTAGLGRRGEVTWPTLLRAARGVRIIDLSRAGCTVHQALGVASQAAREPAIVLIEVGGNDIIGRTDPRQFGADLASLANRVDGPEHQVVMLELPRFPFDDAYGLEQRRVARQYHIHLIPRRLFAAVLASPGGTIDGIHLSSAGQKRLADLVWQVVGPAMGG